jgi:hypothetical protein
MASGPACEKKKTKTTLRDPATLPHVQRPFPKIEWPSAIDRSSMGALEQCYGMALARDPKQNATLHLTGPADAGPHPHLTVEWHGSLDVEMRQCMEQLFDISNGLPARDGVARVEGDAKLVPEMRNEPAPPGWIAYAKVEERKLQRAPLRVLGARPTQPPDEQLGDTRSVGVRVVVDVEFTKGGIYEMCGRVSDFTGREAAHEITTCPQVRHLESDRIALSDMLWFTLEADGWNDHGGRHWFSDEPREIEE